MYKNIALYALVSKACGEKSSCLYTGNYGNFFCKGKFERESIIVALIIFCYNEIKFAQ